MKYSPLALVIALFATGCMVGEDVPTDEDLPPEISEAALGNNARTAFNFFVHKGLTDIQAAGIVGNLMQESSVRPTAVEYGGGPGRGIAQWSIGGRWNHGSNSVYSYAARNGVSRWALQTQLDFIWYELATVGGYGLSDLRAATTLTAAVRAFQNKYEVCGTCAQSKRLQYAQQALSDYGGTADTGGGTDTGSGGTDTGTGGGSGSDTGTGGTDTGVTCTSGTLGREVPQNTCVESKFDGLWYQCGPDGLWIDRWSSPVPCDGEYPL